MTESGQALSAASIDTPPEDLVVVGQIGQPFGIKGWLHIFPYSPEANALLNCDAWWLGEASKSGQSDRSKQKAIRDWRVVTVTDTKLHGAAFVVHLAGVDTREHAESLRNRQIGIPRAAFPPAEKDAYYWVDLIGLAVEDSQGKLLGNVVGLLDNGAHSILQVAMPQVMPPEGAHEAVVTAGKPLKKPEPELIPFVDRHVLSVDLAAKKIVVDWEVL